MTASIPFAVMPATISSRAKAVEKIDLSALADLGDISELYIWAGNGGTWFGAEGGNRCFLKGVKPWELDNGDFIFA